MILTNNHKIPEAIYNHIADRQYVPKLERMSVTDLINPPLIKTLKIRHWDELEQDVSDFMWMLLSNGMHHILSTYDDSLITEHKMEAKVDDITLVGKADVIDGDKIDDYKCTSVWSFIGGVKKEWEQQLNCYAYLRELERRKHVANNNETQLPVRFLRIHSILRDWVKSKSFQHDYPPIPFQSNFVNLWDFDRQEKFIWNRLQDHKINPERECMPSEKWQKDDVYAVMKKGVKRAKKLFDNEEDANGYMSMCKDSGMCYIQKRIGECTRCKNYCMVSSVCPYVNV